MADESLEATVEDNNSLELEVNPPYVGSAYSPEVDIEETSSTITVTITDARGDHSYSVPNTESAISDAEAATAAANAAASSATSAAGVASTAATTANNAATAASNAATNANTKAALAAEKAAVAVQAASDASSAAETAAYKASLANTAASAANSAASAAGNAASAATSAADYADTATRDASAAADAANSAAGAANAAAAAAASATATVDAAVASANSAAAYANEKGGAASNAANAANSAATAANTWAERAQAAAEAAEGIVMDDIPLMSANIRGGAKLGAGLAIVNGALELDGSGDIATAVDAWLDAHPEATTTVQDGSIADAKLVQTGGVLSEVEDIRTGYDGTVYASAGNAVRGQVGDIASVIGLQKKYVEVSGTEYQGWYIGNTKVITSIANTAFRVIKYPVIANEKCTVYGTQCKLAGEFPIAVFSTTDFDGTESITADEIIATATTTATDYNEIYTPQSDGYIIIAYATTATSNYLHVKQEEPYSSYFPAIKPLKIQLFGDSITDDLWGDTRTWATVLPDYLPEYDLTIVNSAVAGSGYGFRNHANPNPNRYPDKQFNFIDDLFYDGTFETDSDVVIVFAGTNNWAGGGPRIGAFGDKPNIAPDYSLITNATIYACVYYVIEKVSTTSDTLLILVTPPQRYNSVDQEREVNQYGEPLNIMGSDSTPRTLKDVCEAIKVSADFYGIPCVDLNSYLGWNRMNVDDFTTDGLHPNNAGDDMIAKLIASEIERHC